MDRNLVKFKKMMTSFLIRACDVIIVIFDVVITKEVESLYCFFIFGWTRLKIWGKGVILGF